MLEKVKIFRKGSNSNITFIEIEQLLEEDTNNWSEKRSTRNNIKRTEANSLIGRVSLIHLHSANLFLSISMDFLRSTKHFIQISEWRSSFAVLTEKLNREISR